MRLASDLPHVPTSSAGPWTPAKFVKKGPDLLEPADVAEAADDVLEGADGAQGPAQTHAHVTHTPDDVLDALEAGAGLLKVRKVTLPLFGNSKKSTT